MKYSNRLEIYLNENYQQKNDKDAKSFASFFVPYQRLQFFETDKKKSFPVDS